MNIEEGKRYICADGYITNKLVREYDAPKKYPNAELIQENVFVSEEKDGVKYIYRADGACTHEIINGECKNMYRLYKNIIAEYPVTGFNTLEAGKRYIRKDNAITGVLEEKVDDIHHYDFYDPCYKIHYTKNGHMINENTNSPYDIDVEYDPTIYDEIIKKGKENLNIFLTKIWGYNEKISNRLLHGKLPEEEVVENKPAAKLPPKPVVPVEISKPFRVIGTVEEVKYIGLTSQQGVVIENLTGVKAGTIEIKSFMQLENIPEKDPLTWGEAMAALSEGKKVKEVSWGKGTYLTKNDFHVSPFDEKYSPTTLVDWYDLTKSKWEIVE